MFCNLQTTYLSSLLDKFISKYFIVFDAPINAIVFSFRIIHCRYGQLILCIDVIASTLMNTFISSIKGSIASFPPQDSFAEIPDGNNFQIDSLKR